MASTGRIRLWFHTLSFRLTNAALLEMQVAALLPFQLPMVQIEIYVESSFNFDAACGTRHICSVTDALKASGA